MVHCGSSGDGDGGNHDFDMLVSLPVTDEQAEGKHAEQRASVEGVHAVQRVQEDLAHAEQQASVKDAHTEERVQESLACTEERMPSTEEHAEQQVSVE